MNNNNHDVNTIHAYTNNSLPIKQYYCGPFRNQDCHMQYTEY